MFKKKDTPELYELLKKNKVEVGKLPLKESTSPPAAQPTADENAEPHGTPQTIPELTAPRPYHKLRNPFPIKIEKPLKKTINGKSAPAKYNNLIFLAIVLVIIALIIYAVFFRSGDESATTLDGVTTPGPETTTLTQPVPPAQPRQPVKYWIIRLAYDRDNSAGQEAIRRLWNFLADKKVADVFLDTETINGANCIVIYQGRQGKYKTKEEASKESAKLSKLHFKFEKCTVVERNK